MTIINGIAVLEDDSHISKWVIEAGKLDHDWYFLQHIGEYIPRGGTVLDIGAMIGDHTEYYANKVGINGKVLAFECNPRAFECLTYNMKSHSHVTCYSNPVSDTIKYYEVVEPCENIGMAYVNESTNETELTSITIDSLNLGRVDLVKIDVEGHEIDVINGMLETIKRCSPTLIIEVNQHTLHRFGLDKKDIFSSLDNIGYNYRNIYKHITLENSGEQFDIVCTKK